MLTSMTPHQSTREDRLGKMEDTILTTALWNTRMRKVNQTSREVPIPAPWSDIPTRQGKSAQFRGPGSSIKHAQTQYPASCTLLTRGNDFQAAAVGCLSPAGCWGSSTNLRKVSRDSDGSIVGFPITDADCSDRSTVSAVACQLLCVSSYVSATMYQLIFISSLIRFRGYLRQCVSTPSCRPCIQEG